MYYFDGSRVEDSTENVDTQWNIICRETAMGKTWKKCVYFLLQAGTYSISSPYIVSFHIGGGSIFFFFFFFIHFFFIIIIFFLFSGQKSWFLVKSLTFEVLVYFVSLDDAVPENNKFDFIWRSLYFGQYWRKKISKT